MSMHDIYNPWHGCRKISEGCQNCYMYFLDKQWDRDDSEIRRTKTNFKYPVAKNRQKQYKVQPGERIRVCMTSDFFLEEADPWRNEVWDMLRFRSDVIWMLLTKRAERIAQCLPEDWGDGWENIQLGVTAENQPRADQRVPILLNIPAKHRHINVAPFIGPVNLAPYLATGKIEFVQAGGENYDGSRLCRYDWVKSLYDQCVQADTSFIWYETGTKFEKDGKVWFMPKKQFQSQQAFYSGLHYESSVKQVYKLFDPTTHELLPPEKLHKPAFLKPHYKTCGSQFNCNGCSNCGNCCC